MELKEEDEEMFTKEMIFFKNSLKYKMRAFKLICKTLYIIASNNYIRRCVTNYRHASRQKLFKK